MLNILGLKEKTSYSHEPEVNKNTVLKLNINIKLKIKTEIMIELHRVVQNISPSIPKGLCQAIPVLSEGCFSFLQ